MPPEADMPKPIYLVPAPTLRYPTLPRRRTLASITDSCSLASSAGHVARDSTASIIAALASRGRTPVFISENVEAELPKAIREMAVNMGLPVADVERVMREQILIRIRVVPLNVGDYLHPRLARIRSCDKSLSKKMRGDPDDLGTGALAEFLAPAVIISKDSVFNRFGLALPAAQWVEEAQRLLSAAGYEAELDGAAAAAEFLARGAFAGLEALGQAVRRHPKTTLVVLGAVLLAIWYGNRHGVVTTEKVRKAGQATVKAAKPVIDRIAVAATGWSEALNAITVVERSAPLTLEERCARQLALFGAALTPSELREILSTADRPVTAAAIRRALQAHPGFFRQTGDKYTLGRSAFLPAIEGGDPRPRLEVSA
jgi:uncharacterized membrane protein (Fun14 family)